ncbi:MAG: hypothetical protein IJH04_03425, partial [Eggerthellaceae bacterium]|nr:hypothetical protein [Eggerthellaceae bacterium]
DEDGNVHTAGLPRENMVSVTGEKVVVSALSNNLPGTLTVNGDMKGNLVHNQSTLYGATITNRTNKTLEIQGIALDNINFSKYTVNKNGGTYVEKDSDYDHPLVRVESRNGAAVNVTGLIANQRGKVVFEWTDPQGRSASQEVKAVAGNLSSSNVKLLSTNVYADGKKQDSKRNSVALVFAEALKVINALNIGTKDQPFEVYVFGDGIENSTEAIKDSYIKLTPTRLVEVNKSEDLPTVLPENTEPLNLNIGTISAGNVNDLTLGEAVYIYRLKGTNTVAIPVPGLMEFLGQALELSGNVKLKKDAMAAYLTGTDADGNLSYSLPNGTTILTKPDGEVLDVTEMAGGPTVHVALGDYEFDGVKLKLTDGVWLNVDSGALELQQGVEFETLMSGLSFAWFQQMAEKGEFKFIYANTETGEVPETQRIPRTYWTTVDHGDIIEQVEQSGHIVVGEEVIEREFRVFKLEKEDGTVTKYYQIKNVDADGKVILGEDNNPTWGDYYIVDPNSITGYMVACNNVPDGIVAVTRRIPNVDNTAFDVYTDGSTTYYLSDGTFSYGASDDSA